MKRPLIVMVLFTTISINNLPLSFSQTWTQSSSKEDLFSWMPSTPPFRLDEPFSPVPPTNRRQLFHLSRMNFNRVYRSIIDAAISITDHIRQRVEQLSLLEEQLEIMVDENDKAGMMSIVSKLNKEVLPNLNELFADNAKTLRQSGFGREFNVLYARQKAAVARILYKSGVYEKCNEGQAFYDGTGRCENLPVSAYVDIPLNGPCLLKRQVFVVIDEDNRMGACICPPVFHNYPLYYNEDDDGCYSEYERGFCGDNEWIVIRNGEMICEKAAENCLNDGHHVYEIRAAHSSKPKCYGKIRNPGDIDLTKPLDFSLCESGEKRPGISLSSVNGTCYAENTQGFCRDGEWMVRRKELTGRGVRISSVDYQSKPYLVCEQVPENCPADGYHAYVQIQTSVPEVPVTIVVSDPYCIRMGIRGACPVLLGYERDYAGHRYLNCYIVENNFLAAAVNPFTLVDVKMDL